MGQSRESGVGPPKMIKGGGVGGGTLQAQHQPATEIIGHKNEVH